MAVNVFGIIAKEFGDTFSSLMEKMELAESEGKPISWNRPWDVDKSMKGEDNELGLSGLPVNGASSRMYSGSNVPLLYFKSIAKGWTDPRWFTINQIKKIGLTFRDDVDRRHTKIIHYSQFTIDESRRTGDLDDGKRGSVRYYRVWNACQLDLSGSDLFDMDESKDSLKDELNDSEDKVLIKAVGLGARILHGGSRAFYSPSKDTIRLPDPDKFHSDDLYHGIAYHELCHWTGHPSRLNRSHPIIEDDEMTTTFNEAYAWEELVAELGSSFLCSHTRRNCEVGHIEYLRVWKARAKQDPVSLLQAAKCASDAAMFFIRE